MADVTGCFSVAVEPGAHQFQAAGDSSLLESARLSNIILPSSCRNGTCRECMCLLISGKIEYRIEWPGLLPEEKDQGCILPCVAVPKSDLVIEVPRAKKIGC